MFQGKCKAIGKWQAATVDSLATVAARKTKEPPDKIEIDINQVKFEALPRFELDSDSFVSKNTSKTKKNMKKQKTKNCNELKNDATVLCDCIVDSGAVSSLISEEIVSQMTLKTTKMDNHVTMVTADGSQKTITATCTLDPWKTGKIEAKVAPLKAGNNVILGFDWMKQTNATFNYTEGSLSFTTLTGDRKKVFKRGVLPRRGRPDIDVNAILMTKRQLRRAAKKKDIQEVYLVTMNNEREILETLETNLMKKKMDKRIEDLLKKYPDVFPAEPKLSGLPKERKGVTEPAMKIETGSHEPIRSRYYQMSDDNITELKRQLEIMIKAKIIRPSKSPWASPCLFVIKKNGEKRLVIDYRKINAITKADSYPLPRIQDNLDRMGKSQVFSMMDATAGFHQNPMDANSIEKTAFITKIGLFEFLVTPFGLKNSPSAFQRLMNEILGEYLDDFVVCYVDDIVVFSKTIEEHIKHLEMVVARFHEYGIQINVKKSEFAVESITYCGFTLMAGKTTLDKSKLSLLTNWPMPENVSAVRSFLGFVGYYRRYIKNFAGIAAPLTELTKKSSEWKWSYIHQNAFDTLRAAMLSSPVLRAPDSHLKWRITTDAGPFAVGGILEQEYEDGWHPVAYEYHRLSSAEEKYSQYEKEFLGLLNCLRKWRHYIEGKTILIQTDNSALVSLLKATKDPHHRVARWLEEYQMFSPDLIYLPGKENPADAPSRLIMDLPDLTPISDYEVDRGLEVNVVSYALDTDIDELNDWPLLIAHKLWTNQWIDIEDEELQAKLEEEIKNFVLENGMFLRKIGNLKVPYLPYSSRSSTIKRFHDGLGHLRYDSIIDLIKRRFWWYDMANCTRDFIASCPFCQLNGRNSQTRRPLNPLPPAALPFERWGLDYVGPLVTTKKQNSYIVTAIDYATRWVVAKAVPFVNDEVVANFLYDEILMSFGCPFEIITDRGSEFMSNGIKKFMDLQKIRHLATSPYHPQTNGMVERMHAMLKHSLITLCAGKPNRWDEYLKQTLFALRVRTHAVTKYSPFYLLYGVGPRLPGDTAPLKPLIPLDELERREESDEFVARAIEELGNDRGAAYLRSKTQADVIRQRNLRPTARRLYFEVNDKVKMKNHDRLKLEFTWKGPYIVRKIGHAGTYYLSDLSGTPLPTPINEDELAPWKTRLGPNELFFYPGRTLRLNEPVYQRLTTRNNRDIPERRIAEGSNPQEG